jgi:hypothetical protein
VDIDVSYQLEGVGFDLGIAESIEDWELVDLGDV